MTVGIYLWTNEVVQKVYVGSSKEVEEREKKHRRDLETGRHHSIYFQRAWDKYGEEVFSFAPIETCEVAVLFKREQWWLDQLKAADSAHGYNISPTAGSLRSYVPSQQQREKVRAKMLGRTYSEKTLER